MDAYTTRRNNETRWGKKKLGKTSDFGGGVPDVEKGHSIWVENGVVCTAPTVDRARFGGHAYDNGGYEKGIRDCSCGAYMLSSSSAGPVDPFGPCPLNPKGETVVITISRELIEMALKYPETDWNAVMRHAVEANEGHVTLPL